MRSSQNPQMDPYCEQRLTDEIIYLHSLWHQGPPTNPNNANPRPNFSVIPHVSNPTPFCYTPNYPLYQQLTPNPNPRSNYPLYHQQALHPNSISTYPLFYQQNTISNARPKPFTNYPLQPTNPISFKKENTAAAARKKKRHRGKREKSKNKKMSESDPPRDSSPKWRSPEPQQPAPETSGWPARKPISAPATQPLSTEDRARFAAIQMQHHAFEACRDFFAKRVSSDSDEDEDGDEDEEINDEGSEGNEEFMFFLKMFVEDSELRSYFEKNYETGDFCCLVCGGIGKKVWKRFKGCVGLVQHSIAISKTKRKRAHRAFGQVVCKVLGWDIDRFPTIVLKDEPLGRSLAKPGESQGEPEGNADDNKDDSDVIKDNVVSVYGNSGENAVSVHDSSGENAASVGGNSVSVNSGENVVPVNDSNGENLVPVNGDDSDAIDKETPDVHQGSC